ncbi:MAG: hypothetical protein H6509_11315 [Bryobacterales bacterium]|nr:hypothetical protein [Bryobacterales bacterium]
MAKSTCLLAIFLAFSSAVEAQPISFFDNFETDQSWQLFEEIVGQNPCYGDQIGEMARVPGPSGGNALRLRADKARSNQSNHLIAYNRLLSQAATGRYEYSLRFFLDPSGANSQTGPEFSIQNTVLTSPGLYSTHVAAIQHQSSRFLSPAGPWAIWTQLPSGSPGWKELFVRPLTLGVWYTTSLEADFLRNEYVSFSLVGPGLNIELDLSGVPIGRTDGLFSEETFEITLETENVWSNCGDPSIATDSMIYYDDAALESVPVPRVVSAAPVRILTQTFQLDVEIEHGAEDRPVEVANVLINESLDGAHACYLAYHRPSRVMYLVNDFGSGLLPGVLVESGGQLVNSQCVVSVSPGSVEESATGLQLHLAIDFRTPGPAMVFAAARDGFGGNSGWEASATFYTPPTIPLNVVPVSPFDLDGEGSRHTFRYAFLADQIAQGVINLQMLINRDLDGVGACWVGYSVSDNLIYLVDDDGSSLLAPIPAGSSLTQENSSCTVHGVGSSAVVNAGQVTVNFDLSFKRSMYKHLVFTTATPAATRSRRPGWLPSGLWNRR